jgi:hypothetical protein
LFQTPDDTKYVTIESFYETSTTSLAQAIVYNDSGTIKWGIRYRNNSAWQQSISSQSLNLNQWYSVELKIFRNETNGEARLWINGNQVHNVTGLNNTDRTLTGIVVGHDLSDQSSYHSTTEYIDRVVASTSYIGPDTGWSNVTKTINSTVGANVRWCVYANDTSNNWNYSSCSNPFNLTTVSGVNVVNVSQQMLLNSSLPITSSFFRRLTQFFNTNNLISRVQGLFKFVSSNFAFNQIISRLATIYKSLSSNFAFNQLITRIAGLYKSVSSYFTFNQSIIRLDRFYKTLAEQITINAIVIRTRTVFTTISSWFSATTSALNLSNFYRAVSSYFNINQNFVRLQALIRPFTQSLTFTDTSTRFLQFYKTVTTYFNINQVSTVGQSLIRSFTNSLNVSTSIANAFSLIRNFAASFIINTASQRIMTAYQTFYQPAAYFDQAIDRIYSYFRPVTALFNIGTGFDRNIHLTLNFLNSFTLNAIGTIGNAFQQIVTASINFADSIARTLYLNINFADSFSINTVITRLRTISKYVTTGFSISDSIYRFIIITRELPQGLFITHSLERAQNLMREFLQTLIFSAHGFKPPLFYNRIFDLSLTLSQSTERLQAIGRIFVQSLNINGAFTRTLSLTRFFYEGFNFFVSLFMQFLCPWLSTESSCLSVGFCHWCSGACQAPECPTPPSGTPPPSGSPITPPPIEPVLPITLSTNIIEVRLYPGEYQIIPIGITNNKNENVQVSLSVEGDIWPFTLFE